MEQLITLGVSAILSVSAVIISIKTDIRMKRYEENKRNEAFNDACHAIDRIVGYLDKVPAEQRDDTWGNIMRYTSRLSSALDELL